MGDIRTYFKAPSPNVPNSEEPDILSCPFCGFRNTNFPKLQSHVQSTHPDQVEAPKQLQSSNGSSDLSDAELAQLLAFEEAGIPAELALDEFKQRKSSEGTTEISSDDDLWIDCFCGERILLQEINIHSNMHQLEIQDPDDVGEGQIIESNEQDDSLPVSHSSQPKDTCPSKQSPFHKGHARRLGKSELGPYAYEDRMPKWLHTMLRNNVGVHPEEIVIGDRAFHYSALSNETHLLIPKLQLLSRADNKVIRSVYCSPVVNHVSKLFKEGGFCGYRNIQMMISYLRGAHDAAVAKMFKGHLPTIFELQDAIEAAWDAGIETHGRQETGGIKNTRKYIGTGEAAAFFTFKEVRCRTEAFANTDELAACDAMLACLRKYFTREPGTNPLAPVYLQYKGHSLTVVGWEEMGPRPAGPDNEVNLIIFDPMFRIPASLKKMSVNSTKLETELNFLRPFRYPRQRFKRFTQFELLFLES